MDPGFWIHTETFRVNLTILRTLHHYRALTLSHYSTSYARATPSSLHQEPTRRTAQMGRGAYDTTTASSDAAAMAIEEYKKKQAEADVRHRIAPGCTIRN
jgi:hypothetical protein